MNTKVTSLTLSKRLKELGVVIDSEFMWYSEKSIKNEDGKWERGQWKLIQKQKGYISEFATEWGYKKYISAPIAEELGELLPEVIKDAYLIIYKDFEGWNVSYENYEMTQLRNVADTITNAMASMVIYLKEQNLI